MSDQSNDSFKSIMGDAIVFGMLWIFSKHLEDYDLELPKEAEFFSQLTQVQPTKFEDITYAPKIAERVARLYEIGEYSDAVFKASKCLFYIIRERSGINDKDAIELIDCAFDKNGPLKFVDIIEPHIENIDSRLIVLLKFAVKYYQRIPAHSSQSFSHDEALMYINLICWLADLVEQKTIRRDGKDNG